MKDRYAEGLAVRRRVMGDAHVDRSLARVDDLGADIQRIITEVGWGSAAPNEFGTTKGIRGQRRIVERSMKMLLRKRKQWHLKRVYWFFWRDPPKDTGRLPCRICYSAGLLRSDREPKPAYRAFKRIVRPGS